MEDTLYRLLKYYNRSPQWIKSLIGGLYGKIPLSVRYGKVYSKYAALLAESQWWPKEKIEEYQWRKIERLLKHGYENVPYYRRVFDEKSIKPRDIKDFDDFQKVPFLTKDIIRNNLESLVARNYPRSDRLYVTTGGSSGVPLGIYYHKGFSRTKELAFMTAQWSRAGYSIGDRLAVLRGNVVRNATTQNFCEYEPIKNRLILSSYHMIEENLPLYIEAINKFKTHFLHAYPSSLTILASYMKRANIKGFPSLKAILVGSENLYPWQMNLFTEVFQRKLFFWYGLTEMCAFGGNCEYSNYYHIFPEYSYVELIEKHMSNDETIGEIVGTTFDNDIMPLIRYRTMDYAVPLDAKCDCRRNYKLLAKVIGRKQEFFVDITGAPITFTCSDDALWGVKDKINAYQYVQYKAGEVELNIEPINTLDGADIENIKTAFCRFYPRFEIEIKLVEHIPRTESGKFRYLVQEMPINLGGIDIGNETF
jgi:phenylacetate-CoA ligase